MNKLHPLLIMMLLTTSAMSQHVITGFSPMSGKAGTTVTITGTGFGGTLNDYVVYFGAMKASNVSVDATELKVTVPVGATYEPISMVRLSTGDAALTSSPFNVIIGMGDGRTIDNNSFAAGVEITAPGRTYKPVFGDINGDLKADLIVTDEYNGAVFIYQNTSVSGSLATNSFADPVVLTTGAGSRSASVADIDHDGKLDVLVANYDGNTFSIFRNISSSGSITTASFDTRVDFATGQKPVEIVVRDVDSDGKLDVTVANVWDFHISVYRNISSPGVIDANSLEAPVDFYVFGTNSFTLSDMDGDYKPDIVSGNYGTGNVSFLLNTSSSGSISFGSPVNKALGGDIYDIETADLDGDGKQDIVIGRNGGVLSVMRNTSTTGNIDTETPIDLATGADSRFVALGDLDGDGKPDITASNADYESIDEVFVFKNISSSGNLTSASFSDRVNLSGLSYSYSNVAIGDIDNDGKPDIVSTSNNIIFLYHNALDFEPVTPSGLYAIAGNSKNVLSWQLNPENDIVAYKVYGGTTAAPTTLLATVDHPSTFYAHTGLNNGTAYYYRLVTVDAGGYESEPSADVSSTPVAILVPVVTQVTPASGSAGATITITGAHFAATPANNIVYFGAARASVVNASATQLTVTVPVGATYAPVSVLNATTGLTGSSSVYFTSTFGPERDADFRYNTFAPGVDVAAGEYPFSMAAGDIDGDGKQDVVAVNQSGPSVSVYHNTATPGSITAGSFAQPVDFSTGQRPTMAVLEDIDSDGKPDLIVANSNDGTISIYRNTAVAGSLSAASFAARVNLTTGTSPEVIAIADVDGDGKRDIVVMNSQSNSVSVFRNIATTGNISIASFEARVDFALQGTPRHMTVADIDGDGAPELLVTEFSNDRFSIWRNRATPGSITTDSFAEPVYFNARGAGSVSTADLDGDGKQDVIVEDASNSSSKIMVFHNTGAIGNITTASLAASIELSLNDKPMGITIGDIDGDGRQDIAVNEGLLAITAFRNVSMPGTIDNDSFAEGVSYSFDGQSSDLTFSDIDGDGQPDLLAADLGANTISIFHNTVDFTTPVTPQNVTATGGNETINIRLTPNTEPDLSSYYIYGSEEPGSTDMDMIAGLDAIGDKFIITSFGEGPLVNGTTYYIRVAAVDSYGNISSLSPEIDVLVNPPHGPVITEMLPGAAVAGTSVTITGENFNTTAANNLVHFGVTKAEVTEASATQLKVAMPLGATYGSVSVLDITSGQSGESRIPFAGKAGAGIGQDITTSAFGAGVEIPDASGIYGAALGDIDGDGKPDLVVTNLSNSELSIYRNTSSPGSIAAGSLAAPVTLMTGVHPRFLVLADLDNDGRKDMIVSHESENTLYIYRNTSSSAGSIDTDSFAGAEVVSVPAYVTGMCVSDMDDDGKQDLIVSTESRMYIYRNRTTPGNLSYEDFNRRRVGGSITWRGVAAGDLDGDGKPEIIGSDYYANTIIVYRNTAVRGRISNNDSFAEGVSFAVGAGPASISIADIDRDGMPDVVVGATSENVISILRNTSSVGNIDETSLEDKVNISPSTSSVTDIAIDDLDGDGRPEVVSIDNDYGDISVFQNLSSPGSITTGSFSDEVEFSMGNVEDVYQIVLGDLDGDGKADITVPNGTDNEIQIFHNAMDLAAPATPTGLEAIAHDTQNVLTWAANTDTNLASYKVFGGTTPNPTTLLETVEAPAVTYTHTGLTNGTIYYYRIAAVKTLGYESELTADVTAVFKYEQEITFPSITVAVYGDTDIDPRATSTNPEVEITYESSNTDVATIVNGKIHITGAGTTTITASQAESSTHFAAVSKEQPLTVSKADQAITFVQLPNRTMGEVPFDLTATATSGLQVIYSTTGEQISITGNKATLLKPGRASITANQPGDNRYAASTAVTRTFCVVPAKPVITTSFTNPETPVLTSSAASGNQWYLNGTAINQATGSSYSVTAQGTYTVKVTADDCVSGFSEETSIVITGLSEAEAINLIQVYPNPTQDKVMITIPGAGVKQIVVKSIDGRTLYTGTATGEQTELQVSEYPSGLYFVMVSSQRVNGLVKFMKK